MMNMDGLVHRLRANGVKIQISHFRDEGGNGGMTIVTATVNNKNFFSCFSQERNYDKKKGVKEALKSIGNGIFDIDTTNNIS